MKTSVFLLLFILISYLSYGQIGSEIPCLDSTTFTDTNYPVKLTNDIKDLQKILTEKVILYPEDKSLNDKYIYTILVDCNGNATEVKPLRVEGSGFLKKRLQNTILQFCDWYPAIHQDYRVASYYQLQINVEKGKCKVIEQKPKPKVDSP